MKYSVFEDGRDILTEGKIELKGSGNNREFWDVASHSVELRREKVGTTFRCTCQHHSIHDNDSICSFKAALIAYLVLLVLWYFDFGFFIPAFFANELLISHWVMRRS